MEKNVNATNQKEEVMKLVVDYKDRYLQNKHRFDSLNVNRLKELLDGEVEVINFFELLNENGDEDDVIIYTSSQVEQYKKYIEDTMYFQSDKIMVPSYGVLRSHENKFFQELYNRKKGIDTNIPAYLIGDISEFDKLVKEEKLEIPFVVKGITGSSSTNVTIAHSYEEGRLAIENLYKPIVDAYNHMAPEYLDLYPGENSHHRQVVIQEYIPLPNYDYRIHIMGDHYWGHKRTLAEGSEYASGSGSINEYGCELPNHVLDYAKDVFEKIDSPFAILDVVDIDEKCYLIEWSGIQLGIVSLLNGERYYYLEDEKWKRIEQKPDIELEFANSINKFIKEKTK